MKLTMKVTKGKSMPPRIVLCGQGGVGKSTFGAESERPIFVACEAGSDNIDVDKFTLPDGRTMPSGWEELLAMVECIARDEHDYKTLVIDTLNSAVKMAAACVCERDYSGQWHASTGGKGFLSYYQGWEHTAEEIRRLIILCDVARARGMNVLLLVHTGVQKVVNPRLGDYERFAGDMYRKIWAGIQQWADIVCFAEYELHVKPSKNEAAGRPVGSTKRVLRCGGSVADDSKCRVGFEVPEEMPFSADLFYKSIGKDEVTLNKCRELWPVLTPEQAERALQWVGSELEDAPVFKLRQLLTRLQATAEQADEAEEPETTEPTETKE